MIGETYLFISHNLHSVAMGGLYHGRILLHWCDTCHVPVLSATCACGATTRPVPVTPPGDARPAFPADIALVNRIYQHYYGAPLLPAGNLVLLSKVPDDDRMEEIVMGGTIVGAIRYLPEKKMWEALPRPVAGNILQPKRGYVIVDDGAVPFIEKEGASVLAPGLVAIADGVTAGDEVFILDRDLRCIGVGRTRTDSITARTLTRGQIVKTRKNVSSSYVPGTATWSDAVVANEPEITRAKNASVAFVRNVIEKNPDLIRTVSFSGGKDSLATLLVVLEACGPVPLLTIDTGLEFPETLENIRTVAERYQLPLIWIDASQGFWNAFYEQGPPSIDDRWCCRVCKLDPVREYIRDHYGEILSFIGQRKYESFSRMKNPRVWRNSYVKNQLCAAPIHTWTALHVWLFIFLNHAPYNILYENRLDRIGCYMCPASDMGVLFGIEEQYPDLWGEWEDKVRVWGSANNKSEAWIKGGWRRKKDRSPQ